MIMKFYSLQLRIILLIVLSFSISHKVLSLSINFAVPSSGEGLKQLRTWDPIRRYLEDNMDLTINIIIARDHSIIKEKLNNKNYDFAVVDSFWFENWKKGMICNLFLEAQKLNYSSIKSLLIVNKDSIYRSLEDLKNHSLALTLPDDSAYGFYVPLAMIYEYGIDPFSYFKEIVFPETYESILKGIAYGKLDSGFITSDILYSPEYQRYSESMRILMKSQNLPDLCLVVRKDFNTDLLNKFEKLLTNLVNSREGLNLLQNSGFSGFYVPENQDLDFFKNYLSILESHNASPE